MKKPREFWLTEDDANKAHCPPVGEWSQVGAYGALSVESQESLNAVLFREVTDEKPLEFDHRAAYEASFAYVGDVSDHNYFKAGARWQFNQLNPKEKPVDVVELLESLELEMPLKLRPKLRKALAAIRKGKG